MTPSRPESHTHPRRLIGAGGLGASLVALVMAVSCTSSPSQPATVTSGSASIAAPTPTQPANGAQVKFNDTVTLVAQNATITGSTSPTYTFEVSTDAAFATTVQTKQNVVQGSGGQTSVKLDPLTPGVDYFWHVRAQAAGTTGLFGPVSKFRVGPAITINAPTLVGPPSGTATTGLPTVTVNNATRTGPAGPITYEFDFSTTSTFTSLVAKGITPEGFNQTSFAPSTQLPANTTVFWRAMAIDAANGVSGPFSTSSSIVTSGFIDLTKVIISYPDAPGEVASWPQTATILIVEQDGSDAAAGAMCIAFSQSQDWPSVPFFGDPTVPVYANQWYFANIGGQWYAGPGEYLRSDRSSVCKSGQGTKSIGPDGGWNTPMKSWVPKVGELVGYMVSTPARNYSVHRTIDQRSNVVVQPWRDTSLGSTGAIRLPR